MKPTSVKLTIVIAGVILMLLPALVVFARTVSFEVPDIKDDYCGVNINYQYCKCAFHGDFCEAIGMEESSANAHVWSEYKSWLYEKIDAFARSCLRQDGLWNKSQRTCTYCDDGEKRVGNKCVEIEEAQKLPDGPFNADCSINEAEFSRDWKKYSDFDDRISLQSRSYEVQQYHDVYEQIAELMVEGFELERDMEIDRRLRLEMREYRGALVQNIKVNLLKSFWRLAYVTYTTVKSGSGAGRSYSTVLTSANRVEQIGNGLKVMQSTIPGDSRLAIDTKTVTGKVKSAGVNAALEAVASLGDPKKIGEQVFKDAVGSVTPSPNITPEEIEILRTQHVSKRVLDEAIAESYRINHERRMRVLEIEKEIENLKAQAQEWQQKERERVANDLQESCKEQTE